MNNNVIPTVYQAAWIESAAKNKYGHLKGQLKQMKNQLAATLEESKRREEGFQRERRMASREGYFHGVSSMFPYTLETSYKNDESKGIIVAASSQEMEWHIIPTFPNNLVFG